MAPRSVTAASFRRAVWPAPAAAVSVGFRWGPPPEGLCWVSIPGWGRYLVPAAPAGSRAAPAARPERPTDLFWSFSGLQAREEEVLRFASQYGLLGVWETVPLVHRPRDRGVVKIETDRGGNVVGKRRGPPVFEGPGEPLDAWRREIRAMRTAVEVWTLLQQRDFATLRGRMTRVAFKGKAPPGGAPEGWQWHYQCRRGGLIEKDAVVGSQELSPSLRDEVAGYDLRHVRHVRWLADYLLRRLLDERLRQHTAGREVYDVARRRWTAKLMPKNLLGALWLQLAHTVEGNASGWRPCGRAGCAEWIGPDSRSGKEYHSDSCRVLAHYHRQRKGGPPGASRDRGKPRRSTDEVEL